MKHKIHATDNEMNTIEQNKCDMVFSMQSVIPPFLPNVSERRKEMAGIKTTIGMDSTGTIQYKFNSLGYRSEEFNPKAKKYIYAVGCSHTLGTGIEYTNTYAYQFKRKIAQQFGLAEEEINLMNFSVGGTSNAAIVHTAIAQCNAYKPNILLCSFTHKSNQEILSEQKTWTYRPGFERSAKNWIRYPIRSVRKSIPTILMNQIPAHNPINRFMDTFKHMLLLQYYCRSHDIPYLFNWVNYDTLHPFLSSIPVTHHALVSELDQSHFVPYSIRSIKTDFAADYASYGKRAHGGPRTNALYAQYCFETYIRLYGKNTTSKQE